MTCREIVSKAIYDYQILYKIRQENAEKIDILFLRRMVRQGDTVDLAGVV